MAAIKKVVVLYYQIGYITARVFEEMLVEIIPLPTNDDFFSFIKKAARDGKDDIVVVLLKHHIFTIVELRKIITMCIGIMARTNSTVTMAIITSILEHEAIVWRNTQLTIRSFLNKPKVNLVVLTPLLVGMMGFYYHTSDFGNVQQLTRLLISKKANLQVAIDTFEAWPLAWCNRDDGLFVRRMDKLKAFGKAWQTILLAAQHFAVHLPFEIWDEYIRLDMGGPLDNHID